MAKKPDRVHMTVRPNAHLRSDKWHRVHYRELDCNDVHVIGSGLAVASPLRTVLDCAATLLFSDGLRIADSALRDGLVAGDELRAAALAYRDHGAVQARKIAVSATGLAANPFESAIRAICVERAFSSFVPQVQVVDGAANYLLDLADEHRKLGLETDGFDFHGDRRKFHADLSRQNELIRRGWLVLRFGWEHVVLEPEWVADVISDALQLRGCRAGLAQPRR